LLDDLGRKDYAFEKFWTEYGEQENEIDWEYDNAGRLIYEKFDHYNDEFDQTSEWIYDLVGNRLKQTINDTITTYNYDINDRLLNEVTNNKTTVYGYDHTQQTSKIVSENGEKFSETTFEYDLQGRMSVVTIVSGNHTEITRYGYGSDGIRISAEHEVWEDGELKSKTRTEYLNDSKSLTGYSQVLRQTEYDAEGNIVKETSYVIGHQRISQTITINGQKTTYYFTFDGHGSTRVLLDAATVIVQLYSYDAYGNAIGFIASEALTEFLYSGEQFDSKIRQQYLRQRYYDPATGRFNRLDPFFGNFFDPQSLHKYQYVHADPVNNTDPKGEFICTIGVFAAVAIVSHMRAHKETITVTTGANIAYSAFTALSFYQLLLLGMIGAEESMGWTSLYSNSGKLSRVPDEIFTAHQWWFKSAFGIVDSVITRNKEHILFSAKLHNVPPSLIASVLYAESWHKNFFDNLMDNGFIDSFIYEEKFRSIGIAQIRPDTIRNHIEGLHTGTVQYVGRPDLYEPYLTPDGKANMELIRKCLLYETTAIDLLTREILFHAAARTGIMSSWYTAPGLRNDIVAAFTTWKDDESRQFGEPTDFGRLWGISSYEIIKGKQLLGNIDY
jgi:RHS repeat-associated protein